MSDHKWTKDSDGDLIFDGPHDAVICPHHTGQVKAAWDFGRWWKWFKSINQAKGFLEKWWEKHPDGLRLDCHEEQLSVEWKDKT